MQFVAAPEKCLAKILQSLLTFFDFSHVAIQMFKYAIA